MLRVAARPPRNFASSCTLDGGVSDGWSSHMSPAQSGHPFEVVRVARPTESSRVERALGATECAGPRSLRAVRLARDLPR